MPSSHDQEPEVRRTARVTNAAGLHARPCHSIVSLALQFDCDFHVRCGAREVNGRSILELMTLGAVVGSELELAARGPGARELVDRVAALLSAGFDETG